MFVRTFLVTFATVAATNVATAIASDAAAAHGDTVVPPRAVTEEPASHRDLVTERPLFLQAYGNDRSPEVPAGGNPEYGFFKGNREFTLTGAGNASRDFDNNAFGFDASVGYFIEDNMELVGRFNGAFTDPGESSYQLGAAAAFDYHFRLLDGRLNPFVGANLGYNFGDDVNDSWVAGPEGGVKYLVNDTTFLYGRVTYQWYFADGEGDAFDDGQFGYAIGVGFKF